MPPPCCGLAVRRSRWSVSTRTHYHLEVGCIACTHDHRLVNPGVTPSPHIHQVSPTHRTHHDLQTYADENSTPQVVGGNAFAASIASTDVSQISNCTTCTFSQDRSNYWTANMYFRARNGTYKRVPQIPNRYLDGEAGGMTIYYTSPYDGAAVTAFKPGFRMLAGHAEQRVDGGVTKWNAICFRCYNAKNFGGDNAAPCSDKSVDSVELPRKACPGGMRTTIRFPTCWDGVNVDSPDQ
jgi:hypothetical protein